MTQAYPYTESATESVQESATESSHGIPDATYATDATNGTLTLEGIVPVCCPAKAQKSVCICIDDLDSCPDNCFLRWF